MSEDTRRVVDGLEAAGEPLTRTELAEQTGLEREALESALDSLRGQQVVRRIGDGDRDGDGDEDEAAFRLTYWPEQRDCVVCGEEITGEGYYDLELRSQATNTESTWTGSLHTACALELLDELSLEG